MGDLISREALKKNLQYVYSCAYIESKSKEGIVSDIIDTIDNAPTVEERPQGEWIEVKPHQSDLEEGIDYREECSICHEPNRHYGLDKYYNISFVTFYKTNFCPNCGADMRGDMNGNVF